MSTSPSSRNWARRSRSRSRPPSWARLPSTRPCSFQFAGLENYGIVLTHSSFRIALLNTVVLTLGAVLISVVLGLGVASLLNREFFGRGVVRTLLIAPF